VSEDANTNLGLDDSLLESAARCLNSDSVRALGELKLNAAERLAWIASRRRPMKANCRPRKRREYERFIELGDIIATSAPQSRTA